VDHGKFSIITIATILFAYKTKRACNIRQDLEERQDETEQKGRQDNTKPREQWDFNTLCMTLRTVLIAQDKGIRCDSTGIRGQMGLQRAKRTERIAQGHEDIRDISDRAA
jgi:hypothetical protein